MARLQGKVALVTGIGAGIGRGIALTFAAEGATVIGCDIDTRAGEATGKQAAAAGTPLHSSQAVDLTKPDDVAAWIRRAEAEFSGVHVLVNAGAIRPHKASIDAMDYTSQFQPTMAGEVDIVFLAISHAWPLLKRSENASIINFASVNAFRGSRHLGMVAHCAAKGAILAMTRQLAVEGGPNGIRANTISPGLVRTAATAADGLLDGDVLAAMSARTLLGRIGEPEDIAWCAAYLASDESRWVTGANFTIDGGLSAA